MLSSLVFSLFEHWFSVKKIGALQPHGKIISQPDENKDRGASLTICILAMNRIRAVKRVIRSLLAADYGNHRVDIHFSIDTRFPHHPDKMVVNHINNLTWPFGEKRITIHEKRQGLLKQWLNACNEINDEGDLTLILEDDLQVMPQFFHWIKRVAETYFHCSNVAGASLQLLEWNPGKKEKTFEVKSDFHPIASPLIGTWGFLPNPHNWIPFRDWVFKIRIMNETYLPRVPGIVMDDWFDTYIKQNKQKSMWSMWHNKYSDMNDLYSIYANLAGRKSFATAWTEPGLHYEGRIVSPILELAENHTNGLQSFGPLTFYDWNGEQKDDLHCF